MHIGEKAPVFTLQDQHGKEHSLKDFLGKKVVLYFYPKDNTPGCTAQACSFRDSFEEFQEKDIVVIGISKDSTSSHLKFAEKYDLPFLLLSDPEAEAIQAYDAWKEKSMFGKKYMGIQRSSILIDEESVVIGHWPKISPKENVGTVLKAIEKHEAK